jgi:hypothetical protein
MVLAKLPVLDKEYFGNKIFVQKRYKSWIELHIIQTLYNRSTINLNKIPTMIKLILILLVALYSHSSDAKPGGDDPSDPCQYKCFSCTRLDGKVFDILRTDPDEAWQRYKVSIKLIKINNYFSVQ